MTLDLRGIHRAVELGANLAEIKNRGSSEHQENDQNRGNAQENLRANGQFFLAAFAAVFGH